ncbi:uncharacterized protein LOC129585970 [Paramacrobiotus metropolitanus]|uniref:uncharacterized protein LOC129585970 n=1 Tax=Paramacrobiotus metropolitanus TaxID=2943436 RepID=UPI002445EAF9|nr:uncharacterized protein LOC129585970 [Paramacrobiotus metropolitanus]
MSLSNVVVTLIVAVSCRQVFCFLGGKMDCGQFFCPMDIPEYDGDGSLLESSYDQAATTALSNELSIVTELENSTMANAGDINVEAYCCFTLPQKNNPITTPFCCTWNDYSDNLYAHTGLTPVSRLMLAFFPVGIAVLVCLVIAFYIVYFICCKMQRTGHNPERRMTAV